MPNGHVTPPNNNQPIQHLTLAYLHEHVIDPSHAVGSADILPLVPFVKQRAAIRLLLLRRHALPRLHDGRHHLENRRRRAVD